MKVKQFLLCMFALFASINASALDFEVDGIKYSTSDGGVMVTGWNSSVTNLVLNGTVTYEGTTYDVVCIDGYAFYNCSRLTSVGDLSACTSIGGSAFRGCSSLTSVGDLSACTSIGERAFDSCSSLTSVGDLSACSSIGGYAFNYCSRLTSVGDLSACTSIGGGAFNGCSSLTSVGDLSACTSIGGSAFRECSSLTSVGDLSACTSIGGSAFRECSSLTSVGDLSACTSIGERAFYSCISLTSVGDLSACTSIGGYAFYNCSRLTSVGDLSACTSIGDNAFNGCSSLTSVGDLSACTRIGSGAFSGCSSLTSVGDLSACTSIGGGAFSGCNSIESITLPGSAIPTLGGTNAFDSYTLILVPDNLLESYKTADVWKDLANQIFSMDDEPQRYFTLSVSAQDNASALMESIDESLLRLAWSIKLSGTINSYDIFAIRNKMPSLRYLDLTNASVVANSYEYYSGCHTEDNVLGVHCFDGLKLVSVKLPRSLSDINDYAFNNCQYLDVVTIPVGVSTIGNSAFAGCSKLPTVTLPRTLTTIGDNAFFNCSSLPSVNIPVGVTNIGNSAFEGCSKLPSVTLPRTISTIGSSAFRCCSSLASIAIPPSVTKIADKTFDQCSSLTSVALPNTLTSIGKAAFRGCSALPSFEIPVGVSTIGIGAFYNCTQLTEVRIPSTVSSIGNNAFNSCDNLADIWNDALVPQSILENVFSVYSTAKLHVPNASKNAYQYDAMWGKFLNVAGYDATYSKWVINNQTDFVMSDQSMITTEADATGEIEAGSAFIANNTTQELTMGEIVICDNGTQGGSLISNGHVSADWLTYAISVNARRWYFLTFPGRVKLSDVSCEGSWVIRYYDGAVRAQNGSGGWQNLPEGTEYLEPGQGYIFQCNQAGTLMVKVPNANAGQDGNDKSLALSAYTSDQTQHASWNYLGNPFTSYYSIADMGYSSPITVWTGSSYQAVRSGDDVYHLRPFQAFFVQKPEGVQSINFRADSRESYNMTLAAQNSKEMLLAPANGKTTRQFVNLMLGNGTENDQTRVVFNEQKSNAYELDCDAAKFMTAGVPQLYTLDGEWVEYAINERQSGAVNVGYTVPAAGTYTLVATRMDKPMLLKDNELGITFDLNNGSYEFESAAGTFNNRFSLVENEAVTGISQLNGKQGVNISAIEGGLHIGGLGGQTVSIYSVDGKLVGKYQLDGVVVLQRGAYVVSVDGMKTKVMVK